MTASVWPRGMRLAVHVSSGLYSVRSATSTVLGMADLDLVAGALIGARYRLDRQLGEGGMGVVWAAEDVTTHQHSALKFLKHTVGDPDGRRRFLREGRTASAVRHPNVVTILEVLEPADGSPVIVMELLDGESLRDVLARAPRLARLEMADIMVAVVSAVGAAHALGIVHRDLKPENIFLARAADGERVVKVLDFGIAKLTALDGEAMHSTGVTTGAVLGTPAYMAPEQVFGEKDLDHRADIWALGIIVYQCLSGILPTAGENVGQVLKHVLARPFAPLEELVPDLPPDLSRLVARMVARERSDRPDDLREVLALLERFASTPGVRFDAPAERSLSAVAPTVQLQTAPANRARVGKIDPFAATRAPGPRPRARPRAMMGGAVAIVLVGLGVAGWRWARSSAPVSSPAAARSPLDLPDARIACPILRASGVEEPAGWLGAAAAAIACERARVILGGRPERTLVPAELLDLPASPTDSFPQDPYGPPGARARSVTAAQQRAQAYLDGEVTRTSGGFTVALSLHRADGTTIGSSTGDGPGLYQAVRSAMAPLIRIDGIPRANVLEPQIARWARTENIDDALGVLDLTFALAHNAGDLPRECRHVDELSARVRELGPEGRRLCAMTLGQPPPDVDLDASDPSEAGIATRIRINHSIHPGGRPDHVDLPAFFKRESTPRGRSLLAAIQSCLLGSTDSHAALEWALTAVQSEPKNPEGGQCNPWEQLTTLARDTPGADAAVRAMQAWMPWNSYAWLQPGFTSGGSEPVALRLLRRARVLSPFDAFIADTFASSLLASGDREEARGVAVELQQGGLLLHDVESELILVRFEISQARFGAALERARKGAESATGDVGWVRVQRFELAWHALELAVLLGRAHDTADWLVEHFLAPDPPLLESNFTFVPMRIPVICALSSAPGRCFTRFRSLRQQLPGAITADTDDFLIGAERYVTGDLSGAARAWRPLLGGSKALAAALPDPMVEAFERTGAADLAEQVDQEVMKRAGELNGATLGHVRSARRALARGDRKTARRLAEQVVKAWSVADEPPPALAEMRQLLARLDGR